MTKQQHPITPPYELIEEWIEQFKRDHPAYYSPVSKIATQAAQWGADQQLAEDAEWLDHNALNEPHLKIIPMGESLKEAMRPKPPSLKEQALETLQRLSKDGYPCNYQEDSDWDTLRRALEQLDD